MAPELASIKRTQEMLGEISRQTVYNLVERGDLRRVNLGRRAFITGESIEHLLCVLKRDGRRGDDDE